MAVGVHSGGRIFFGNGRLLQAFFFLFFSLDLAPFLVANLLNRVHDETNKKV